MYSNVTHFTSCTCMQANYKLPLEIEYDTYSQATLCNSRLRMNKV